MSDLESRKWLREALQSLPEKTRKRTLTGALSRYADIAERARDSFQATIATANLVLRVFRDAQFPNLADRITKASESARSCNRDLSKSADAVTKKSFDNRVIAIKDFAAASGKPVAESWEKLIIQEIATYEQVGRIAADRGLPGGTDFNEKLKTLRERAAKPPVNPTDADAVGSKLRDIPKDIKALGLTGKAGKFLISAAEGRGIAKDLEVAEIREMLDRYQLWTSLRVSLGPRQ